MKWKSVYSFLSSHAGRDSEIRDVCTSVQAEDSRGQCRLHGGGVQETPAERQQW